MSNIIIEFPDGSKHDYNKGVTGEEIVRSISEGLARNTVAMMLDGQLADLTDKLESDHKIRFLTWKDPEGKEVFRHSAAHIFAQALQRVFPEVKIAIGPPIENGFHYDFEYSRSFTPEDLGKIEEEMKKIVEAKYQVKKLELPKAEALKRFADNKFKVQLINELAGETARIYEQGEFFDFCKGPHAPNTGMIKAFKLTKVSGAYWKADAKNEQLQRVYGIAFPDKKELNDYLKMLEEAEKRDHRKLTQELDLVFFHEYAPGAPFFLKKGTVIYNTLINFIREEYSKRGYQEVITPQLYNKKLWETSGHWDHYRENMFIVNVEGQEHSLKPMNCPSHCLIYNRDAKSYKDLPIRIADFCNLHRNEFSGTLTGLVRVRKFSQDDGHIFCRFDQIEDEVLGVLDFIKYVWNEIFGFKLKYYLSTRPEKSLGTKELWDSAESILASALKKAEIEYTIKAGDGAFYGPKIDIDIEDALGRKWQCPTCQLDFNLPERFQTLYVDAESKKQKCVMIHRAILGSLERFFGIMTEHYAGKFPLWLSPVQVKILPIADRHLDYCRDLHKSLSAAKIRSEINDKPETTSKKVREAQLEQVNFILVIGDKEIENKTVNVRTRDEKVIGETRVAEFVSGLTAQIAAFK